MSVDQKNTIDHISIDSKTGNAVLRIFDHLPFDLDEHLFILQSKTETYIDFIEGDDMSDKYEVTRGRTAEIKILFRFEPPSGALEFMDEVKKLLAALGIAFSFEHVDID